MAQAGVLRVIDASGTTQHMGEGLGDGTSGNPYVPAVTFYSGSPLSSGSLGMQIYNGSTRQNVVQGSGGADPGAVGVVVVQNCLSDNTNIVREFAAIVLSDGVNGNNQPTAVTYCWNSGAAGYDRIPGSAASGLKVQGNVGAVVSSGSLSIQSGLLSLLPTTSGGITPYLNVWTGFASGANIKATPGQLFGGSIYNRSSGDIYLQFFNNIVGNTNSGLPVLMFVIPASGGSNIAPPGPAGWQFSSGISLCVNGTPLSGAATAPISGTVFVNLGYK